MQVETERKLNRLVDTVDRITRLLISHEQRPRIWKGIARFKKETRPRYSKCDRTFAAWRTCPGFQVLGVGQRFPCENRSVVPSALRKSSTLNTGG
jgi:hypothetical protein